MEFSNDAFNLENDSEKAASSSEVPCSGRPNRFKGPKSTWRTLTDEERLAASSITQLRDRDLSIHLYNAHAMKRSCYDEKQVANLKSWASKDRWQKERATEDNGSGLNFVPLKSWTAWPLSADVVPRTGERIGPENNVDAWTFKRREPQRPSRELEEMVMAITLRISRDRFERRDWEGPQEDDSGKQENGTDLPSEGVYKREALMVGKAVEETSQHIQPGAPENGLEGTARLHEPFAQLNQSSIRTGALRKIDELSGDGSILDGKREPPLDKQSSLACPTISADDERSRRLLRPTIRHTLSRLDELLMALHNARQTCLYAGAGQLQADSRGGKGSADDSGNSSHCNSPPSMAPPAEKHVKRSGPGRPRKVLYIPASSAVDTHEPIVGKSARGRKRKLHIPREGESREEMLVRIARLQKRAMPFTSAPTGNKPSTHSCTRRRDTLSRVRERRSTRLGLRDWSEIVGAAAVIGFPPKVITRTTQRCANLFGEGMTMLSLVENPASGAEDQIVHYLPNEILDFDSLDSYGTASCESEEYHPKVGRWPSKSYSRSGRRSSNAVSVSESEDKTSSEGDTSFFCPYPRCQRHIEQFSNKYYLLTHLKDIHKLGKEGLREMQEDSEEEMDGGVHLNGFMKEVRRRAGWRGEDKERRSRKRGRCMKKEESVGAGIRNASQESADVWDDSEGDMDEALDSD